MGDTVIFPPEMVIRQSAFLWAPISFICWVTVTASLVGIFRFDELAFINTLAIGCCLLIWSGSRFLPNCHQIKLDAYGITVTRYFKSQYFPWKVIYNISHVQFENWSHVRFDFNTEDESELWFFDQKGVFFNGLYSVSKARLFRLMKDYHENSLRHDLPMLNPAPTRGFYENKKFYWGRKGGVTGEELPQLTVWERLYNWRNK